MRILLLFMGIFIPILYLFGGESASDFEAAKELSGKLDKPILIDFMAEW